jgi:hypothetical protein
MIPLDAPPRRPRMGDLLRALLYTTVLGLMTVSGCAAMPLSEAPMGLRDDVDTRRIKRVAIVYIGTASGWAPESDARDELITVYSDRVEASLTALGVEALPPSAVQEALADTELAGRLSEALQIDRPLDDLFEEISPDGLDERVKVIMALRDLLGVDAVLIGQIVYHAESTCDGSDESDYTPYVVFPNGKPEDARVPCAVSHFEAKLVDTRTGRTIWYNRALREARGHAADAPAPDAIANAEATVDLVLRQGPTSLQVLVRK